MSEEDTNFLKYILLLLFVTITASMIFLLWIDSVFPNG
jgi:hypothetical protein